MAELCMRNQGKPKSMMTLLHGIEGHYHLQYSCISHAMSSVEGASVKKDSFLVEAEWQGERYTPVPEHPPVRLQYDAVSKKNQKPEQALPPVVISGE